jgi:hypothetical protein
VATVELVIMVALESVKHRGQRYLPDAPMLVLPDDVDGLIEAGLAVIADIPEEPQP